MQSYDGIILLLLATREQSKRDEKNYRRGTKIFKKSPLKEWKESKSRYILKGIYKIIKEHIESQRREIKGGEL